MAGVTILVMAAVIVNLVVKVDPCSSCGTTPRGPTHAPVTSPRVMLQQGILEGVWRTTRGNISGNTQYAAFFGIPYAQAPIGSLRFKAPRPHPGWPGVRPAKEPAAKCAQGKGAVVEGSEDCLYLNVFTSNHMERDPSKRYPVYVFIHGGIFQGGFADSDRFGPDYLLPHDIILVIPQYRLNSFGFLSLDTEEIPGNSGVKDTVAAMQWIYGNIARFGGDPNRITVGGQSAGAGMAGWLTLLPELSGRIQRAILMSGSAFHNWAYKESHVATALKVASSLANQTVTNTQVAERILMNASTEELHLHGTAVGDQESRSAPELPFAPTPERRTPVLGGEPRIITKDAESYFLDPVAPAIPHLISTTNAEWRVYYFANNPESNPKRDEDMLQNLTVHVPKNLLPYQDTRQFLGLPELNVDYNKIIDEVREGIRGAVTPTCDLGCTLKTYFDGIWQLTDAHRLAMFRAKENKAETYLFKFSVRTEMNQPLQVRDTADAKDVAVHSDDLNYIFAKKGYKDAVLSPEADLSIRRMSAMWANYIKSGKPIERPDELLPVAWPPNTSSKNGVTYLELKAGGTPILHQAGDYSGPMIQFWQDLYKKYRSKTPAPVPLAQRSLRSSSRVRGL